MAGRQITRELHQRILEALYAGCTMLEIRKLYQVNHRTVAKVALKYGIQRRGGRPAARKYDNLPRIPMYVSACGQVWRV